MIHRVAPRTPDDMNRRTQYRGAADPVGWGKNRTESQLRAKVQQVIGVITRVFGFTRLQYRGCTKTLIGCSSPLPGGYLPSQPPSPDRDVAGPGRNSEETGGTATVMTEPQACLIIQALLER